MGGVMKYTGAEITSGQLTSPTQVTPALRNALADCWVEVSSAGGAAGFPFPPVDRAGTGPALDRVIRALDPGTGRRPGALRLAEGDNRDETLMVLTPL
jgi:hypothetical protein